MEEVADLADIRLGGRRDRPVGWRPGHHRHALSRKADSRAAASGRGAAARRPGKRPAPVRYRRPARSLPGIDPPVQGLDVLFDAAPRIVEETGATIAVVGEVFPESRAEVDRLMRRPIASRIRLVDRYVPETEMDEWLAACDVVVCPYRKNSGSGIAARAIAARRPVVASDQSGFPAVRHARDGRARSGRASDRLAEETVRVLRAGAGRFEAGLDTVAQRFSWESYADAVEGFTASILRKRGKIPIPRRRECSPACRRDRITGSSLSLWSDQEAP